MLTIDSCSVIYMFVVVLISLFSFIDIGDRDHAILYKAEAEVSARKV